MGPDALASRGSPAAAIELVGVSKHFASSDERVHAVRDVDLLIEPGEFFSLLGPSGCGKTTTLRMIAGFETPTAGRILLYGDDVVQVPPNKRDVNMVFQSYALFPHMSVYDNIAFGLRRQRVDRATIQERVGEVLGLVELEGRERRRPRELSGGQQQRVALARALVNRPRALLLDEPLGALDLKLRQAMEIELKRIQREVGITFVYVTHDQGEALTMSDRLAVMRGGRVEQLGAPRDVYERPATRFVAGFIGTSNILGGAVARTVDGDAIVDLGNQQRIVVPLAGRPAMRTVVLTVRPEKVALFADEPSTDCRVQGVVGAVVYQGTFTSYQLTTTSGDVVTVHVQNAGSDPEPVEQGDRCWMGWSRQHSYLLDETSESGPDGDAPGGQESAHPREKETDDDERGKPSSRVAG